MYSPPGSVIDLCVQNYKFLKTYLILQIAVFPFYFSPLLETNKCYLMIDHGVIFETNTDALFNPIIRSERSTISSPFTS